jgi:hypothetical protein
MQTHANSWSILACTRDSEVMDKGGGGLHSHAQLCLIIN